MEKYIQAKNLSIFHQEMAYAEVKINDLISSILYFVMS